MIAYSHGDVKLFLFMIIDGKRIAARIFFETKERLRSLSTQPGLGIVQVGDDPASTLYVSLKERACRELGIAFFQKKLPAETKQETLLHHIEEWNADPVIHGIVVQLPLPKHFDTDVILNTVAFDKDVDGLSSSFHDALRVHEPTPWLPALMASILACCEEAEINFPASRFLLCTKSERFATAFSSVLLFRNASVTVASTANEALSCFADASAVVTLLGIPHYITEAGCSRGSVVIDCGITKRGRKVLGDFAGDAGLNRVRAFTPVPGGVGPVTVAMLIANTVTAAQ